MYYSYKRIIYYIFYSDHLDIYDITVDYKHKRVRIRQFDIFEEFINIEEFKYKKKKYITNDYIFSNDMIYSKDKTIKFDFKKVLFNYLEKIRFRYLLKNDTSIGYILNINSDYLIKEYYIICGKYKEYNGGFLLFFNFLNREKNDVFFYNIYHGEIRRYKSNTKPKKIKNKIIVKLEGFGFCIEIKIKENEYKKYLDINDINDVYLYISRNNIIDIDIYDINYNKIFKGSSNINVIDKRSYV